MKTDESAKNIFMISHFILSVIIPLLLLTFCNVNLIRALRKSRNLQKRHSSLHQCSHQSKTTESTHRITLTLVVIIAMFVILVTPAEITNFVRDFRASQSKRRRHGENIYLQHLITYTMNGLQKINFAVNFILYCIINVHFRKMVWRLITCKGVKETFTFSRTSQNDVEHSTTFRTVLKETNGLLQKHGYMEGSNTFNETSLLKVNLTSSA